MDKIKIILQGGGTRCAYQMAFLNKALDKLQNVDAIYGTSFGALVGYFYCIRRLDLLYKFFTSLNKNSLVPHFNLYGYDKYLTKIPLIGHFFDLIINIIWLLQSIHNKSLYNQSLSINSLLNIKLTEEQQLALNKFYCCVYNITRQKIEYINGSHPLILEYIAASSSLWIIFEPKLIQQLKSECLCDESCDCEKSINSNSQDLCTCDTHKFNEFMDGGLLKSIPFDYDEDYDGKYLILTTKNIHNIKNKKFLFNQSGKHLFEYLDNIITFLMEYQQYLDIEHVNKDWYKKENIILINYEPITNDPTIIEQQIIKQYIQDGEKMAELFLPK